MGWGFSNAGEGSGLPGPFSTSPTCSSREPEQGTLVSITVTLRPGVEGAAVNVRVGRGQTDTKTEKERKSKRNRDTERHQDRQGQTGIQTDKGRDK